MDEFATFFADYHDYPAPRLDIYEQAVYLYVSRHTITVGKRETTIGFKSARKKMAFGVGKAGTAPSEGVIYEKLKSLESKGCIKVLSSERLGTRLTIFAPREIPGLFRSLARKNQLTSKRSISLVSRRIVTSFLSARRTAASTALLS